MDKERAIEMARRIVDLGGIPPTRDVKNMAEVLLDLTGGAPSRWERVKARWLGQKIVMGGMIAYRYKGSIYMSDRRGG